VLVQENPAKNHWTMGMRVLVFALAATSIACLLFDFYRLCPMRIFTFAVFLPALVGLGFLGLFDLKRGDGRLVRALSIGVLGGLIAAVSYDTFRLPFVFSKEWGLSGFVPTMPLFKVFPRFGAMILGQPLEQDSYSIAAQLLGWAYHFSNGATFGIMYVAMIGNAKVKHWGWAVLMAVVIELGMLLTPYPQIFGIPITARFVAVTMAAHGIFGVGLGLVVKALASHRTEYNRSVPSSTVA
jgi:hypothetical protein